MAQWMLVQGSTILAMGQEKDPYPKEANGLDPVELQGGCVLPGFIDSHCHLHQYIYRHIPLMQNKKINVALPDSYKYWLDFSKVESKEAFLEKLQKEALSSKQGEWILGGGWNNLEILPHREELDRIFPYHPVFLKDASLHSGLVNSQALKLAEINESTHDPIGGRIDRDAQGFMPTGLLFEQAMNMVQKKIPTLPQKILALLLPEAMKYMNQYGIVGIHDMENFDYYEIFSALSWLLFQNPEEFTVRCLCSLTLESWQKYLDIGKTPGMGNEMLRFGHLKLIYDGSLGARTAYMNKPYPLSAYRGEELVSRSEVRNTVKEAIRRNVPLAIHAIGDRATQNIAEIFAEFHPNRLPCGMMHRIEHVQAAETSVIESLAKSGIAFSVQPIHIPSDLKSTASLQPHLLAHTHAYRDMIDFGKQYNVPLILGTDFPVAPIHPLWNIYSAVTRSSPVKGIKPSGKDKNCLTRKEAIEAYTSKPARVAGEGAIKGSLCPGKLADFIVLSHDILQEEDDAVLLDAKTKATYLGGKCVYQG